MPSDGGRKEGKCCWDALYERKINKTCVSTSWLLIITNFIGIEMVSLVQYIKSHTDINVLAKTAVKCYSLFAQGYIKKNINDFTSQSLQINRNCPSTDEGGTNAAK